MSEEERSEKDMDKKTSSRTPSAPPKGNGADCRRENGNYSSRNGKGGWKREGAGPRPRNEQNNRKPYSQKPRPVERRPRPRESYNYRQGEEVTDDYRAENSSVLKLGNKKKNLNHLLNFSVSSRDSDTYSDHRSNYALPTSGAKYKRWSGKKSMVKYNKEQFLQANCQFVVKEGDYTVHSVDPDILVDWDHIEQIRIYSNEVPSCPICLYPPVAAKITRCGHIYCWRCMLHYLSLSDRKTWRKCPICYEAVHQKDLKSVKALEMHSYQTGEEITMRLMKREKGSTYAMPVEQWQRKNGAPHGVSDEVDLAFSKLLVASPDEVQRHIIDVERAALETQLADEGESLEGSYVKSALDLLKERQVSLNMAKAARDSIHEKLEILGQQDSTKPVAEHGTQASANSFSALGKDIVEYSSAFSDEETTPAKSGASPELPLHVSQSAPNLQDIRRTVSESSDDTCKPLSPPALELPSNTMAITTRDGEKVQVSVEEAAQELVLPPTGESRDNEKKSNAFYFYQASDGQQIYMQSLNARCMVKEYGSLENCPKTITARIVEMEGISMNEELRGRLKYLNHLPLTCEFKVAELALKPPLISKETLQHFADDIEKRKRLRQRKNRDERRQLKKMQEHQNRKYEQYPEMRALLHTQFLECSSTIVKSDMPTLLEAGHSLSPAASTPETATPIGSPSSVDLASSLPDDGGQASLSFAQMLRAGKAKAKTAEWPKLSGTSSTTAAAKTGSDESDNEDRVPVPTYKESFGDAIKAALESYDKQPGADVSVETSVQPVQADSGSGKKKKKKTKTLLFTTNMARNK